MSLEYQLTTYLRAKPPSHINFDNFDTKEKRAFSALEKAFNALLTDDGSSSFLAFVSVEKHWPHILTWMYTFGRSMIDERPSTPSGLSNAASFAKVASIVLVFPMYNPSVTEIEFLHRELVSVMESAPEIPALITELWLYACEMDLGQTTDALIHAGGMYIGAHTRSMDFSARRLTGRVAEKMMQVWKTKRLDLPNAFVRGVNFEAKKRPTLKLNVVLYTLTFINVFLASNILTLQDLSALGAIRQCTSLLKRLSTSYQPDPVNNSEALDYFDEKADCMRECMYLFQQFFSFDIYFLIPALEGGILVSVWKAKDLLIEDSKSGRTSTPMSVAFHFSSLFLLLHINTMHRPIFVRVSRSMKRVEKMGMGKTTDEMLGICGGFKRTWENLKMEIAKRKEFEYTMKGGDIAFQICGNLECPHPQPLVPDHSKSFSRCSGCRSDAYCSLDCRKQAWNTHKSTCSVLRRDIEAGLFPRAPGQFEKAFLWRHFRSDIGSRKESFKGAFRQHRLANPGVTETPVMWIDFREHPVKVQARSVDESRKTLDMLSNGNPESMVMESQSLGADSKPGGVSVIGVVLWRRNGTYPLLVGIQ